MKDINKANFTAFKRYVFDLFKEQSKLTRRERTFDNISIVNIYIIGGNLTPSGLKQKEECFAVELMDSSTQLVRISLDNSFLKDWLCDLSRIQVDTTNLKESWNKIILDSFFERIKGVVNFE